ncbi:AAA ATPase midasin, partial [Coemansia guatemalensis]
LGVEPARLLPATARVLTTVQREGDSGTAVGVAPFFVETGSPTAGAADGFALHAPTTLDNATRVLRAMHVGRAVLLEGSPGVGKTALVSTLARVAGQRLERINLSDQTDIMDLFGTDVPAAGGGFAWRDAPFLQALRRGDWVLLDEINLASQSVLEGLNSCLDHRGAVYISELDREFTVARGCRIFAAQNPLAQGGGRKGLPRSFVNRFTAVHVAELQRDDLQAICDGLYGISADSAPALEFNWRMHQSTMVRRQFGAAGAPWEFNLRDVNRLMELARAESALGPGRRPAAEAVRMLYVHRMRTPHDRDCVRRLFAEVFGRALEQPVPPVHVTAELLQIGGAVLPRLPRSAGGSALASVSRLRSLHSQLPYAESLARCLEMRWMPILVGAAGTGKTALVRWLAQATGNHLVEFSMNASVDTSELLGGFEQVDVQRHRAVLLRAADALVDAAQAACDFGSEAAQRLARQGSAGELFERVEELLVLAEELLVDDRDELPDEHLAQAEELLAHADSGADTPPAPATLIKLAITVTRKRLVALQRLEAAGRFEWVDGVLVQALERGHWLLVDRANLCSAAVLDRLNGLLEPGGVLHVNEDPARSSPVVPHPRFRMILAVDPHYGELSRAMRNRGVEICLLPAPSAADCAEVAHASGLDRSLVPAVASAQPLVPLVQHAMHAAECVQRGAVAELVGPASAPLLFPAPQLDARDAATVRAWWLAGAVAAAHRAEGGLRLLLAVLSTLPPSPVAPEALLLRAMLPADTAVARALALPEPLANAVERARTELALSSSIDLQLLAAVPLWLELNPGVLYALNRYAACDAAAAWHPALLATLLFWRERAVGKLLAPPADPAAARELVLKRPNVDATHAHALFAVVDGCTGLVAEWDALAAAWPQATQATSDLTLHVRSLRALHGLAHRLVALLADEHVATASEQAVALEGIQTALRCLEAAPGRVGQQATSLLHAVDRLVLDASHSARIWTLLHPTTLPDQKSRDLETTLWAGVRALPNANERDAAVEALALLYAAAGRKNKDRIVAAVEHFVHLHSLAALPTTHTSTAPSDVSPAGVIADIVQLGSWHHIARFTLLAGCLPRDSPLRRRLTAELQCHVSGAAVAQHSPWALLLTRLGWAVNSSSGAETARALLPLFTDAAFQWHLQLTSAADFAPLLDAPTLRLWRPVATELSWKRSRALLLNCTLLDCDDAAAECRALGRSLALFQPSPPSVADQLVMCIGLIMLTCSAAATNSSGIAESPHLVACTEQLIAELSSVQAPEAAATVETELIDYWHTELLRASAPIADLLVPAADALCAALKSFVMEDACLALVEVAVCLLAVSLPARPVDPAAKAHARSAWLADDITTVAADLDAYQLVQRSMTGESDTLATRPFVNQLAVLEKQRSEIELVYRPATSSDGSRFADLWQDAHNLLSGVLGRVRSTCKQLMATELPPAADIQALTATLDQFETRARTRYFAAFRDVAQLWCLCVRQANLGLTQLAELRRVACAGRTRELARHVHDLYRLPMDGIPASFASNRCMLQAQSQLKAAVYSAPPAANPLKAYGELSTALLTRIVVGVQVRGSLAPADLEALDAILRDAYEIHKRAVDEKRRRDAEAASLFKFQGTVEQTDEQLLSEIFPGYEDIYDDLADDSQKPAPPSFQDISEDTVATIAACHQYLMLQFSAVLPAQDVRHAQITAAQRHALLLACSLSQMIPELATMHTGSNADVELRGANLVSLATAVRAASTAESNNGSGALAGVRAEHVYDFYKDAAASEAMLLKPLAQAIAGRAEELLQEWPDHAVLQQIRDMAQRLLQQPVTAPLAKLLSGLELLHTRAQDWEAYASRDLSISQLHDAAQLIIRWRQQELNSWPHLLRAQELAFVRRPNELWFGLYAALVVPERVELPDLAGAVDQFLQGSPAGEFHGRLNMLWAFARHRAALLSVRAAQENTEVAQALRADSVYGPLTNAIHYYLQYSACISEHLDRTNQAVRKDLAQYVRISSWKDVNPAALRASAQKTHKHLTKCVRRWREALSQPIFQITQLHQSAAIATVKIPPLTPVSLPLRGKGFDIAPAVSLSSLPLGKAAPWADAADGGVPAIDAALATAAASYVTSAAVAKVLEASPLTLAQLHRHMGRAPVFGQPLELVPGALEAFAGQIVADISHFQSVETPKHLTKAGAAAAAAAKSAAPSKKRIIRSKKPQADEAEAEDVPDEEERQRLIQQFWGEQRNQRRTRLKEILKAMQQLGLRRHFRAAAESSGSKDSAVAQPEHTAALKGLAPVLAQPPLDVAAWQEATAVAASTNSTAVYMHAPVALDNWQQASAGFFQLSAQLAQLRTATFEDHSPEVGAQQIQLITNLMECLNHHVVRDRQCASDLLSHATSWMQAVVPWTGLATDASPLTQNTADPVALKRAIDETVALLEQLFVAVRMITDAGVWNADCTTAATQATAALSAGFPRVRNAQQQLATVHASMVATQMSGMATEDAGGMLAVSHAAAVAVEEVKGAVEELQTALHEAAEIEARLAPGLLEPWRFPLTAATDRLAALSRGLTDASSDAAIQMEMAEDIRMEMADDAPAEVAELAGQWTIAVMNVWQAIHAAEEQFRAANNAADANTWGFGSKELLQRLELVQGFSRALHLPAMIGLVQRLTRLSGAPAILQSAKWQGLLTRVVRPWICQYSLIVQHVVALYAAFHRALVHFALTTTTALTSVIVHGLGSNDVFDTEEGSGQSLQSGTGMGDGSTAGAKNVSDEIEGEDQVEGLQGAEQDPNDDQNEPSRNEDAVEMDNDFDGQLGDADLESDNADSDEEKSDDEDNEDDLDEQVGDVDPTDPTSLDDKLWNDEEKDESKDEDSKVDGKAQPQNQQSDIVAGDEDDDGDDKNADSNDAGEQVEDAENDLSDGSGDDEEESDAEGSELGDQVNQDTLDRMADVEDAGEQLDMPEDLDMDAGDESEEDDGIDADMGGDDLPEDEPIEQRPEDMDEDSAEQADNDVDMDDATEGKDAENAEKEDDQQMADDSDEEMQDGSDEGGAASDHEGASDAEDEDDDPDADGQEKQPGEDAPEDEQAKENSGADKPTNGVDSAMNMDGREDMDPNTSAESQQALSKPSEASTGNEQQQQQPMQSAASQQEMQMQPDASQNQQEQQQSELDQSQKLNPERTLADVIEKWERRLNVVMRENEPEEQEPPLPQKQEDGDSAEQNQETAPEASEFEHVKQDEHFDKVALADAEEQERDQQDFQPMDIDEDDTQQDDDHSAEQDAAAEQDLVDQAAGAQSSANPAASNPQQQQQQQPSQKPQDTRDLSGAAQMQQSKAGEEEEGEDGAMDSVDERTAAEAEDNGQHEHNEDSSDELQAVDIEQLRAELEQETAAWREDPQRNEQAQELWQAYTRLTHDLSLTLSEQLRLILTPTQATQLRGDYRTGKRLNMKRIIPYIASDFRKDKIWLRRTKPARREYQVMVALDNSKSMAQSTQAVELAYETLALVTTALNQLEVGQLAVVSFGADVSLLHPFDCPFDAEAGARVLSRFTFVDDKTDVVQLMDASLQLFDAAAVTASATAEDLWRLQLVISDGVCQDHARLLRQVRAAMEQRIMTVFIVLDRSAIASAADDVDPEKDSIMNTQHVSFVTGPNGKMEMKVERYLDTFPFKYYVVLRDIHGLPAVLAETLRQYFSLVGSE